MLAMLRMILWVASFGLSLSTVAAADWVRAGLNTNQLVWGARGGLLFAIHPAGFRTPEPRGLIRLGYPILTNGDYDLVNFIAIEPVVKGRKGFSELERSRLDDAPGKRLWVSVGGETNVVLDPGKLSTLPKGVEQLDITLRVEKFDNNAHVRIVLSQRSDAPDELRLIVHAEPDSASMDYCILTATMGNMARTRQLWLKDEVASSLKLYPSYQDIHFAPHTVFPLKRLLRTTSGETIVAVTTDEDSPMGVHPFSNSRVWYYGGVKVTQYWKKPNGASRDDLHAVVNARYTYWQSRRPIPGGIAFENFELREKFYEGQEFIFGITRHTPRELGFRSE
jgi:hypothetical protein